MVVINKSANPKDIRSALEEAVTIALRIARRRRKLFQHQQAAGAESVAKAIRRRMEALSS
jgi:hypothetical protein